MFADQVWAMTKTMQLNLSHQNGQTVLYPRGGQVGTVPMQIVLNYAEAGLWVRLRIADRCD